MAVDEEEPPVLPPGGNVSNLEFLGCILGYALVFTVILGLPIALVYGAISGDWRLLIPWAISVVLVFIFGRLNMIPIIGS